MGDLLTRTLDLYAESWKKDHKEVMRKYRHADRINEGIRIGIFLFDNFYDRLAEGATNTFEGVLEANEQFTEWYGASSFAISEIEKLEKEEYTIELADDLRARHKKAGMILEELGDAVRTIMAIEGGSAVSMAGFLDELRNPVQR